MSEDVIRTEDVPQCPLCGNEERRVLYAGLRDRLFGAPGEWTFKECLRCGLAFLDPRPAPRHLKKAYTDYHTHSVPVALDTRGDKEVSLVRRVYRNAKNGYIRWRWGYGSGPKRWQVFLVPFIYLWPTLRADLDFTVMYLEMTPGGRLLDVGCGSGELLERLKGLGWQVEGVDFDESAVRAARKRDLKVQHGTLESQGYSDGTFDAVVMSHVIEHVPDPLRLLEECYRILKLGGRLVLVTPNKDSWTHKTFKHNWRGLEPPRHLYVFAPQTLHASTQRVGFQKHRLLTTVRDAHIFLLGTLDTKRGKNHIFWVDQPRRLRALARLYRVISWLYLRLDQKAGDETVLIAGKRHDTKV